MSQMNFLGENVCLSITVWQLPHNVALKGIYFYKNKSMIGRNRSFIWKQQGKFSLGFYSAETVKIFS